MNSRIEMEVSNCASGETAANPLLPSARFEVSTRKRNPLLDPTRLISLL